MCRRSSSSARRRRFRSTGSSATCWSAMKGNPSEAIGKTNAMVAKNHPGRPSGGARRWDAVGSVAWSRPSGSTPQDAPSEPVGPVGGRSLRCGIDSPTFAAGLGAATDVTDPRLVRLLDGVSAGARACPFRGSWIHGERTSISQSTAHGGEPWAVRGLGPNGEQGFYALICFRAGA
jgi:hypothetical protein